jgi:multiple sugar transport system substrate-binding protein
VAHDLASAATQRGLYAQCGGQPAHRSAWMDDRINANSNGFYRNTLATLDASYLRPRFDGYVAFQHTAGALVGACAEGLIPIASAVNRLNDAFARAQGLVK